MNNLSPAVFVIPFIALILAVIGYLILLKKESDKSRFKLLIFIITIIAFVLNFIWEMLQMPLYNVKHVAMNVANIRQNIARSVHRHVKHVQKSAGECKAYAASQAHWQAHKANSTRSQPAKEPALPCASWTHPNSMQQLSGDSS